MAINIEKEELLTASQACNCFPNSVSLPTVWRWLLKGAAGVKLESVKIGGRRYTSAQACLRFIERTTESKVKAKKTPNSFLGKQADAVLDQFGI